MPKAKSKKSVAKRFKKTGTGKVMYSKAGTSHLLSSKNRKRKRRLRGESVLSDVESRRIRKMLSD